MGVRLSLVNRVGKGLATLLTICSLSGCLSLFVCLSFDVEKLDVGLIVSVPECTDLL